jgi:hypothetical protein
MPYIHSKGSPDCPVWVLVDRPLADDSTKGYLYSAPLGWVFDKMMKAAGFEDYYVTCYRPDTDHDNAWANMAGNLNTYHPPIIIPLGAIGQKLIPAMQLSRRGKTYNEDKDSELSKYCGSLLTADRFLNYPHYIVPTFEPQDIVRQWKQRDVVINCDLGKAFAELEYWKKHGHIQPLPERIHKIEFSCFDELLSDIDNMLGERIISNDIETIYPKAPTKTQTSQFYRILPGYPICVSFANSSTFAISFDFFRENVIETRELWKHVAKLVWEVPSLGQNFFNFDALFYRSLGMRIPLDKCKDTLIDHHILWPELKHSLQFQTRMYTREPYYKDEGHQWNIKDMKKLKTYNCKDTLVTYEIHEYHLKEFEERPWLK